MYVCMYAMKTRNFDPMKFIPIYNNNQINARAMIGLSAVGYCAGKPTEKSRLFWIMI